MTSTKDMKTIFKEATRNALFNRIHEPEVKARKQWRRVNLRQMSNLGLSATNDHHLTHFKL